MDSDAQDTKGGRLADATGPSSAAPIEPVPVSPVPASVPSADTYRGWTISWDYGRFTATDPNYDASYEGEEDGWVASGGSVQARTREALIAQIDAWIEDNCSGHVASTFDPKVCGRCGIHINAFRPDEGEY